MNKYDRKSINLDYWYSKPIHLEYWLGGLMDVNRLEEDFETIQECMDFIQENKISRQDYKIYKRIG